MHNLSVLLGVDPARRLVPQAQRQRDAAHDTPRGGALVQGKRRTRREYVCAPDGFAWTVRQADEVESV
jgi:hypothetical protein